MREYRYLQYIDKDGKLCNNENVILDNKGFIVYADGVDYRQSILDMKIRKADERRKAVLEFRRKLSPVNKRSDCLEEMSKISFIVPTVILIVLGLVITSGI